MIFEHMPRCVFKCIWEWMCGKWGEHWLGSLVQVRSWSCGAHGDGRRQIWVRGQSSTGSQCLAKSCLQVTLYYLAALQALSAKARCCGTGGFSCVEQGMELWAVVFQPNMCAWASVARCCPVLQFCAGSVSEPCDNFNLGIKKGLYWGLGMSAASFGSGLCEKLLTVFCK